MNPKDSRRRYPGSAVGVTDTQSSPATTPIRSKTPKATPAPPSSLISPLQLAFESQHLSVGRNRGRVGLPGDSHSISQQPKPRVIGIPHTFQTPPALPPIPGSPPKSQQRVKGSTSRALWPSTGSPLKTPQPLTTSQTSEGSDYALTRRSNRNSQWKQKFQRWSQVAGLPQQPGMGGQPLTEPERDYLKTQGYDFESNPFQSGSFGVVYRCEQSDTGVQLVCKVMSVSKFVNQDMEAAVRNMQLEGDFLRDLSHPHIVECIGVHYLNEPKTGFPFMRTLILMERMDGDLLDLLNQMPPDYRLTEEQQHEWVSQIAGALKYLHDMNVVHFDIKPENILISGSPPKWVYKLNDFGFASKYEANDSDPMASGTYGTVGYVAPETPGGGPWVPGSGKPEWYASKPCDIYAMGVTILTCYVGCPLAPKLLANFRKGNSKPGLTVSPECMDFVVRLCADDPRQRPTVETMQTHPWFTMY